MLDNVYRNKTIYTDLNKSIVKMESSNYITSYPFVVTCEKLVIGVILLE